MKNVFHKLVCTDHWRVLFLTSFVGNHLLFAALAYSQQLTPCAGVESRLLTASQGIDRGMLDEAQRILLEAQTSHPECADVLLGLSRIYTAQADLVQACRTASRYTKLVPGDPEGYYHLANCLSSQGNYKEALSHLDKALSLNPNSVISLVLLGQIQWKQGLIAEAEVSFRKACDLAPSNVDAHFQLGSLLDALKRHSEAVTHFERVVALDPRNPRAYDYLALNLEPLGEIERAEQAYEKGLRVNQGPLFDAFLDYNYGRFLMKQNRLSESGRHLDRALKLTPNTRAVHYEHSKLNLRLGRYAEARTSAERALSLADPTGVILDLQVYYLLSRIYTKLGEESLARKYYKLSRTATIPIQTRERK